MRPSLFALAVLAACSDGGPALSDAISLACPTPGALPFRLSSSGFQNSTNKALATDSPRRKDEASDTIGNAGGLAASSYLLDAQPATATVSYRGAKARTGATSGLTAAPLVGENVSLWSYDPGQLAWQSLGRTRTGDDGYYELPASVTAAANRQPIYAVLEADGSCAAHIDTLLAPGAKVVVSDIDGTLTRDDLELFKQLSDATYLPLMMPGGDRLMQAWAAKRYPIIYLTARPHLLRAETRGWLDDLDFPLGSLLTAPSVLDSPSTAAYKTAWMTRMIDDFGWDVVAAYGNADTDITAYANAGVPEDRTFIVGPLAGAPGTIAIQNMDFAQHIETFVAAQPANP